MADISIVRLAARFINNNVRLVCTRYSSQSKRLHTWKRAQNCNIFFFVFSSQVEQDICYPADSSNNTVTSHGWVLTVDQNLKSYALASAVNGTPCLIILRVYIRVYGRCTRYKLIKRTVNHSFMLVNHLSVFLFLSRHSKLQHLATRPMYFVHTIFSLKLRCIYDSLGKSWSNSLNVYTVCPVQPLDCMLM